MMNRLPVAAAAGLSLAMSAGCDHSAFDNPAKTCVAPDTFSQILDLAWGLGDGYFKSLHRKMLAVSSPDAVLMSYDKTTRKISCQGTIKISDNEHNHSVTPALEYSIQPTADGKSLLYEIAAPSQGELTLAMITLEGLAKPEQPQDVAASTSAAMPEPSDPPASSDPAASSNAQPLPPAAVSDTFAEPAT